MPLLELRSDVEELPMRLRWSEIPEHVRAAATSELGAQVVADEPQSGGFSPGLASRVQLSDGSWWFIKAISGDRNPRSPELYRREIEIAGALPKSAPAPGLRWWFDDGDWVLLVFEAIAGRMPAEPWQPGDLQRVLGALEELAGALTPTPVSAVPTVAEDLGENFGSWRRLAAGDELVDRLDPDVRAELDRWADLEAQWEPAAAGNTLVHADLRADNLLVTASGQVYVVDWPYAVTAAPWLDGLLLLVSVAASTPGIDPQQQWSGFGPARTAEPDAVDAVLAAVAGDFCYQSLLPAPANVPTLRAHQQDKARAALSWLRSRRAHR